MALLTSLKLWLMVFLASAGLLNGLEFEMQTQQKCIFEEINSHVIVVGDWKAFHRDHVDTPVFVELRVEDPHGTAIHDSKTQSGGQFAFTSKMAGEYKACFTVHDLQTAYHTKLKLEWKTGVAATDWNAVAKKEHLDALTVELRKLEDHIREVYSEMLLLQQREQEMRDISEQTNSRVAWLSFMSLAVCVGAASWQVWYLKKFFQRKKLL